MRLIKFFKKIGQAIKEANETANRKPRRRYRYYDDTDPTSSMHNQTDVFRHITDPAYSSLSCNIHNNDNK
jgi:hypothetical protein